MRSVDLDDPKQRREFRKNLASLGLDEVRYRLDAQKYSEAKAAVVKRWIADVETGATIPDELEDVADQLEGLKERFVNAGSMSGLILQTEDEAKFVGLLLEAKTLIDDALGAGSDFVRALAVAETNGTGMGGGPSFVCVTEITEIVRGAAKRAARKPAQSTAPSSGGAETYVAETRIAEIKRISSSQWDMSRLSRMCEELNSAHRQGNLITVAMLVRAILDHVPPIFQQPNFAGVASQHGGQSFKGSMRHLEQSMRKIADGYLHQQVRARESLPTAVQVDVRRDLDVLLAEVVRLS